MKLIYVFLTLNIFYEFSSCKLSCKDENNQDVDWFIGLKYPKNFKYIYINPTTESWKTPKLDLSEESNLIGLTIKQTYASKQSGSFYAFYNDEHPESINHDDERGHLKGVISFDNTNGFWLVHSVPKFPTFDTYTYRKAQSIYGQSFLCVSLTSNNLPAIVYQLLMMQSTVYSYYLPDNFPLDKVTRDLLNAFVNNKNTDNPNSKVIQLKTLASLPLLHFGKSQNFSKDLYAGLVSPTLKNSILVESWVRGDRINSSCETDFKVFNVQKVKLLNEIFAEHDDHSKWALSENQNSPFICIGDINRMTSQFKRGGGTLCIFNLNIWTNFSPIVVEYENCKNSVFNFLPEFIV